MMKLLPLLVIFLFSTSVFAQESTGSENSKATLLRSVAGNAVDSKGMSTGIVHLKKDMSFNVVSKTMGQVTLSVEGQNVQVPADSVQVQKVASAVDDESYLHIVSAKYGRPGQRQYEVKEEIKKRIPKGPITGEVKILISDALLRARANELSQTGTLYNNGTLVMSKDTPCILTITYEFNGKRLTKEAMEGHELTLP